MDKLQSMKVFEQVASEKSFSAVARGLAVSPSIVTRHVRHLEDQLGVQLLQRTTRRLALTAAGEAYLDRVRGILLAIHEADEAARTHARAMSGRVRVLSLPGLATHLVAPAIAAFRRQHPKVTIDLHCDSWVTNSMEQHDVTLLTDRLPLPNAAVVRPIASCESILCASPDYIRRYGSPTTVGDLARHAVIRVVLPGLPVATIKLVHERDPLGEEQVDVSPALVCNDHEAALRSTLEGAGVSSLTTHVAAPLLREGLLQRVLAPWLSERFMLLAAFASRRHMPARARAFLDHMLLHATQAQESIRLVGINPDERELPQPATRMVSACQS